MNGQREYGRAGIGRWGRRLLAGAAASALLALPAVASGAPPQPDPPTVTPAPQELELSGRDAVVTGKRVRVIVHDEVSAPTEELVVEVLRDAGADVVEVVGPDDDDPGRAPLTVRVGLLSSKDVAAGLDELGVEVPEDLPDEGYALGVDGTPGRAQVVLGGVDPDGAYYAAQTLRQLVVEGDDDQRLSGVRVVDHPSMPLRGTIEGFYGAPWTHEERLDQLRFHGDVKMNTYIYAPKDDPYHRDRWREPYPPEQLAELAELVEEADANHVRFTFALSPGFHEPPAATRICFTGEDDYDAFVAKLQEMYDVGVRAFSIPFDDISLNSWSCASDAAAYGLPDSQENQARAQAEFLNRIQNEFLAQREGTYPLQMVPTHYEGTTDTAYRRSLRSHLDDGVEVMWTGMATVPPHIRIADADDAASVYGRKVFVWDNYPVNDFGTPGRLHLAPYQEREPGLSDHVVGIVSNPMNQAGASKVALLTIADFVWNEHGYDHERSWAQSARYLAADEDAVEPLLTFFDLNHLAPTFGPNPWLPQAPALAASIEDFWERWDAGQQREAIDDLRPHAANIADAPDRIRAGVGDPIFLSDVERWLAATELWAQALTASLDASEARLDGDDETAERRFSEARDLMQEASTIPTDPRPRPQGTVRVADGVLDVFLTNLRDPCTRADAPDADDCPSNLAVGKPATQSSTGYGGVASRAVDGDTNGNWAGGSVTHTAEDGSPEPWWEVDLEETALLHSIHVWNRTDCCSERLTDYYVLVSEEPFADGSLDDLLQQPGVAAFHEPSTAGTPTSLYLDHLDLMGRYVRVQLTGNAPLSIAEVEVLADDGP